MLLRPYIHTSIHSYIHTSIHSYMHTSIHSYIHTFIHPYIHTSIHSYMHTSIHPSIHPFIHPSMHTCIPAGRYLLVSSLGRVEKTVEAHKGAVLGALWSHDGSALITCMFIDAHIKWISLLSTDLNVYSYTHALTFQMVRMGRSKYGLDPGCSEPAWHSPVITYTHTPVHPYTHTPIHPYTRTPVHPYTHTPIHPYTLTHTSERDFHTMYYECAYT